MYLTAEELLTVTPQELCQTLTTSCPFSHLGNFSILTKEEAMDNFPEYQEGDVAFYYNYNDDELREVQAYDKQNILIDYLYDEAWLTISEYMQDKGYEEVENIDGSGNGLYYGMVVFRKI